jgi:poly-gamma-glutamate synthesis protein (capsule biosynthesis protein)
MAAIVVCALLTEVSVRGSASSGRDGRERGTPAATAGEGPVVTLAFAGDVHFEGDLAGVPDDGTSTLGPMSDVLAAADIAMVNLESAVTERGEQADKELEDPSARYWFRTGPRALDVLERSGVDVVSVANNHGADFGLTGVRDTIRADEASAVEVLGVGRNDRQAYAPHRVRVRGVDVAVHAADASPRESDDVTWAAAPGTGPGIASASGAQMDALVAAVAESARTDDVVVVYLHWGEEGDADPTLDQQVTAAALETAGADVVVGTHAHTPLGAGLRGSTYVSYGLGNFYWYHGRQAETGVLNLAVQDGGVVADEWVPGRIPRAGGAPRALSGDRAAAAVRQWEELRSRTDLTPGPGASQDPLAPSDPGDPLPAFVSTVEPIGTSVRRAMRTYDAEACPVPLADLRHLTVTHVGFDGQAHRGELVVNADVASDVVSVFESLYAERFPIERMLLIDDYAGDDDLSMAGNNSSGFNCRRVAGSSSWSDHAYGRAIDINPVQNPYVVGDDVRPPAARAYLDADRSAGATGEPGVVRDGDVVRREFERIGWQWGGSFADPDYQHFSLPDA